MTEPAPKRLSGRRQLFFGSLAGIVLVVAWIAYFLASFDLNDYRKEAESRLATLLGLPVKIGAIRYNLHDTNLALRFADLRVGDGSSSIQVDTANIIINLQWQGLLKREIKFAKISLLQPIVLVRSTLSSPADGESLDSNPAPLKIDQVLLRSISIAQLEILGGIVRIDLPSPDRAARPIEITELDGVLSAIGLDKAAQLTMSGMLRVPGQQTTSAWQLEGTGSLQLNESNGLTPYFKFGLRVRDLDLSAGWLLLAGHPGSSSITGSSDLNLHMEGSPDASLEFQGALSPGKIIVSPGPSYTKPLQFNSLAASGRLQISGDHPGISDLSLQVDESRLNGSLGWTPHGQPFAVTVTLLNSSVPTTRVKSWLPDGLGSSWELVRKKLQNQGSVNLERAEVTLFETNGRELKWRLGQIKGVLREMAWELGDDHLAEITSLPFDLTGNLWQINGVLGQIGALHLSLDGRGEYSRDTVALTSLDFSGDFRPDKLLEEWRLPSHATETRGQIGIKGHLEGPLSKISLDLQADLSQLVISHPSGLHFVSGPEDKLALHATLSPEKISLDHGSLKWSVAKGHLSGSILLNDPESLTVDALLSIEDLRRVADTVPFLGMLQLHGQADLSLHQQGMPENNRPELILTLRDAGLRATKHIADLEQINGRVRLTANGLVADNLHVHLGQSPLTVQARIDDFNEPRLILDVRAPAIRASELVFHSEKAQLRDIDGHLEIDHNGLTFAPVDVRLDGGTLATVRGTIALLAPYDVNLDITSEFANIGEVISLWTDRPEIAQQQAAVDSNGTEEKSSRTTIRINALAKRGDLYGMSFHDASGVIIPTPEHLTIHPLDFSVGEGFCNAQVISDFSSEAPTLLRVSGHAEDVDALEVYRELLNQKNIVRGKLRGDFYLSGETGANYLPSSYGTFNIQIHDGVLHEFQFLSKVFSLLNVSQIFALELPDMDRAGMPFVTLTANLQLDKGLLRSEDLKIQSEAMNQAYNGQLNLLNKQLDLTLAIHPLGTVDKIVSHIPVAGWLLTGDDRALLTAHFSIKGTTDDVSVNAMPLDTLTEPTLGLLKRTLQLPFKLFEAPEILWGGENRPK
jgi:uncharacterized protein involved in outer membrane biogenesis